MFLPTRKQTLPLNKQRERRVDFKLAQKQPNVMDCYNASGRARVWTRCGSDRARFPDEKERAHFFSPLQNFLFSLLVFLFFLCSKSFSLPIPVIKLALSLLSLSLFRGTKIIKKRNSKSNVDRVDANTHMAFFSDFWFCAAATTLTTGALMANIFIIFVCVC